MCPRDISTSHALQPPNPVHHHHKWCCFVCPMWHTSSNRYLCTATVDLPFTIHLQLLKLQRSVSALTPETHRHHRPASGAMVFNITPLNPYCNHPFAFVNPWGIEVLVTPSAPPTLFPPRVLLRAISFISFISLIQMFRCCVR